MVMRVFIPHFKYVFIEELKLREFKSHVKLLTELVLKPPIINWSLLTIAVIF